MFSLPGGINLAGCCRNWKTLFLYMYFLGKAVFGYEEYEPTFWKVNIDSIVLVVILLLTSLTQCLLLQYSVIVFFLQRK